MSTDLSLDKEDPAVQLSIKILFERVQRNKRCVLVYLYLLNIFNINLVIIDLINFKN